MKKVTIKYTLKAPVSHIGEIASTGSYFQTITTKDGKLPVITGNAIRGQLRDSMALHWFSLMPVKVSKDIFNIFFSGGNINGTMRDDVEKAKKVRQHFPFISLLGGGLGDMIMAGKVNVGFAYPVCKEAEAITGIESDISWHSLIGEIEFTRTDDSKNDKLSGYIENIDEEKTAKASTQMRYSVQYVAAGAEFVQEISFRDNVTPLELGAFYAGLLTWFKLPILGGMAAKGFGAFDADVISAGAEEMKLRGSETIISPDIQKLVDEYEKFVESDGLNLEWLSAKKEKKNGKKTDDTD